MPSPISVPLALAAAVRPVVAVVTVELMSRWERLLATVIGFEHPLHLGHGQERSPEVLAVAVSATLVAMTVNVVGMGVHPSLTDSVNSMWSIQTAGTSAVGVADRTFGDLERISLKSGGIYVVIGSQGLELSVR